MCEIILDEREWAENVLRNCDIGKNPYKTISMVSKYYYADGYSGDEIRRLVGDFIMRCDTNASLVRWRDVIDSAINNAEKHPLVDISGVSISKQEMERISKIPGVIRQKLMFALLCVSKYEDIVRGSNNHWVNFSKKDVFSLANVKVDARRQSLYMNDLWQQGLIGFSSIVDNVNIQVLMQEDGECEMFVSDFRNLGNQYMQRIAGGYIVCENCGAVVKRTGRRQKYCSDCARIMNCEKTLSSYYEKSAKNSVSFDS